MKVYNHLYFLGFSVVNGSEEGEATTGAEARKAIMERLASLSDAELLEAIELPCDSYEVAA